MLIRFVALFIFVAGSMNIPARAAYGQETVTVALTSKAFQYTILLVSQERIHEGRGNRSKDRLHAKCARSPGVECRQRAIFGFGQQRARGYFERWRAVQDCHRRQ
jgi:hypothetical protein